MSKPVNNMNGKLIKLFVVPQSVIQIFQKEIFMMGLITFLLMMLFLQTRGYAIATIIPSEVKNVVSFIFVLDEKGNPMPNGTAFFVLVKDELNLGKGFGYLVTAKHVIQDNNKKYLPFIYIRLNKRDGGAELIKIPLSGKDSSPIHIHSDPDVDLAVIPMVPSQDIYEYKMIPEDLLTTAERFKEANIRTGDEVFFIGLFEHFFGAKRNYPIARFGRVALITDEKIPWKDITDAQAKLLDLSKQSKTKGQV